MQAVIDEHELTHAGLNSLLEHLLTLKPTRLGSFIGMA